MDFPIEEYRERLERTRAQMVQQGLPVLLLHQPETICYLSGFLQAIGTFAYHALIVPLEGDPVLILRDMEEPGASTTTWVQQRAHWSDVKGDWLEVTKEVLDSLGLGAGTIGIEYDSWFLTLKRYYGLRRMLPKAAFVEEPGIVERLRRIKSPREVEVIRAAAGVADAAMHAGMEAIAAGVSERELAVAITAAQIRAGGENPLAGIITSGERTNLLHGTWSDRRLRRGDQVYFELFAVVWKYHARLLRTAVVGRPSAEQTRAAEVLLGALNDGIGRMRPGVVAAEIDEAIRGPVLRAGLRETYTNKVGYGLGLLNRPTGGESRFTQFVPGVTWVLEAGMVLHMLVMARGIGFSETVLVTEEGTEVLTQVPRRLVSR